MNYELQAMMVSYTLNSILRLARSTFPCSSFKYNFSFLQLPPLEEMKKSFGIPASYNEGKMGKLKPLKLPKCPNSLSDKQSMFWMEPLGIWVPLRQVSRSVLASEQSKQNMNSVCSSAIFSFVHRAKGYMKSFPQELTFC